jgi:hypothetical protein
MNMITGRLVSLLNSSLSASFHPNMFCATSSTATCTKSVSMYESCLLYMSHVFYIWVMSSIYVSCLLYTSHVTYSVMLVPFRPPQYVHTHTNTQIHSHIHTHTLTHAHAHTWASFHHPIPTCCNATLRNAAFSTAPLCWFFHIYIPRTHITCKHIWSLHTQTDANIYIYIYIYIYILHVYICI